LESAAGRRGVPSTSYPSAISPTVYDISPPNHANNRRKKSKAKNYNTEKMIKQTRFFPHFSKTPVHV
jgi:hypothetical protein